MYASFHKTLLRWYQTHGRHALPWRNSGDAYGIYVSEIMLQQTQVKTVLERFYTPFMTRFPTLQSLAQAPQDEVLKQWQGLGYYSRATNLHKAAQLAGDSLPDSYDKLLALPGIGRNTAHAILAFAYHQPYAVMEANVKRLIQRIFALPQATPAQLWEHAAALLNHAAPFDHNQAMMDLGAMICTPKNPACPTCPARSICKGKANPLAYPAKTEAKITPVRSKRIIVLEDANGRFYLTPRSGRFLGGLYGFAEIDRELKTYVWHNSRYTLSKANQIGSISQTYSHFRLDATVHHISVNGIQNSPDWYPLVQINSLPLSKADEKVLALLCSMT